MSLVRSVRPWAIVMLSLAALNLSAAHAQEAAGRSKRPPNIVYIMADDLGWTDTGVYGSRYYETPHIDRLATEGVRFTRYHNCQNCQPTRAALMTGQYGARTGVYTVGGIDRFDWESRPLKPVDNVQNLPLNRTTIAHTLKQAGYATAMFGKWHLGENGEYHPAKRGFDEALVTMGAHFNFRVNPPTDVPSGVYLADWLTDRAVDFIERKKEGPFFLYLPHFGVHSPHHAKPELIAKFKKKEPVGGHSDPVYAAMIASVDESVGRIAATLERLGIADETVLIFTSDNGGVGGYAREGIAAEGVTDDAPLRSGKGSLYEGGIRVPLIVRYPGVTPAGKICEAPSVHVDMFPTIAAIAGAKTPPANIQPLDGESLLPLFSDPQAKLSRKAVYHHFPGYLGSGRGTFRTTPVSIIESEDWKLMEFLETGKLELYHLVRDPGERNNLASEEPQRAAELLAQLKAWRSEVNAPMPTKNDKRAEAEPAKKKGKKKAKQNA